LINSFFLKNKISVTDVQLKELRQRAAKDGLEEVQEIIELEKRLLSKGFTANRIRCPAHRNVHRKPVGTINQSRLQSIKALGVIEASKSLKKR
jgi:hypothetical protein